jgi:hypothetical protein
VPGGEGRDVEGRESGTVIVILADTGCGGDGVCVNRPTCRQPLETVMKDRICLHRILALLLSAVLIVSAVDIAHSDCQSDQEQALGSLFVYTVGELSSSMYRIAQTFQVGLDGKLAADK